MITLIFSIMMISIFGNLIGVAFRMTWGLLKIALGLVFLPAVIIVAFAAGLLYIAFPVLAIVGLISLIAPKRLA